MVFEHFIESHVYPKKRDLLVMKRSKIKDRMIFLVNKMAVMMRENNFIFCCNDQQAGLVSIRVSNEAEHEKREV